MAYADNRERDDDKGITFLVLLSLVLLGLSNIFQLAAISSNHWVDTVSDTYGTIGYSGLWQRCTNFGQTHDSCRGFQWTDVQVSHWFRTVQTLEVLGFLFGMTALVMMLLNHFVPTCYTNRWLKIFSLLLLGLAFVFLLSGGSVIGNMKDVQAALEVADGDVYMSWSFGISITAMILYLASAIAVVIA